MTAEKKGWYSRPDLAITRVGLCDRIEGRLFKARLEPVEELGNVVHLGLPCCEAATGDPFAGLGVDEGCNGVNYGCGGSQGSLCVWHDLCLYLPSSACGCGHYASEGDHYANESSWSSIAVIPKTLPWAFHPTQPTATLTMEDVRLKVNRGTGAREVCGERDGKP